MVWKLRLNSICITVLYSARTGSGITHIWTTSHIYDHYRTIMRHVFVMSHISVMLLLVIRYCRLHMFDNGTYQCNDRIYTILRSHLNPGVIAHGLPRYCPHTLHTDSSHVAAYLFDNLGHFWEVPGGGDRMTLCPFSDNSKYTCRYKLSEKTHS